MKEPSQIKESDSWNQFCTSGRIEDYLSYVSCRSENDCFKNSKSDCVGDSPHAGVYSGNRNYIETDAYR